MRFDVPTARYFAEKDDITMPLKETNNCTICGLPEDQLFSNRPLHKGREQTLLICPKCLDVASRTPSTPDTLCSWCGGDLAPSAKLGDFAICTACIDLCRHILAQ